MGSSAFTNPHTDTHQHELRKAVHHADMAWNSDQKNIPSPSIRRGLYDPIVGRKEVAQSRKRVKTGEQSADFGGT